MDLVTTQQVYSKQIKENKGIVIGGGLVNFTFQWSFSAEKNKEGHDKTLRDAKQKAIDDLATQAQKLKANAVVDVKVEVEMVQGLGLDVSAIGTAVVVE